MKLRPHCFQLVWGKMATVWERTVRVDRMGVEPVSEQKVFNGNPGQINNPKWGAGTSGSWGNIQTSVEFEESGRCGSPEQAYPWLYSIIMWPLPPQELSECKSEERKLKQWFKWLFSHRHGECGPCKTLFAWPCWSQDYSLGCLLAQPSREHLLPPLSMRVFA